MSLHIPAYLTILFTAAACLFGSCIEDGFTSSPSDQPEFSTDTLKFGTVFTGEGTTTNRFVVHNRHSKGLSISSINLSGEAAQYFRLNVDGMSGHTFTDVEIRAKDSIYIFVEATLPITGKVEEQDFEASLDFMTNGVGSNVILTASGLDVNNLTETVINSDTRWESPVPYRILDSIVVAEGAELTLGPGVRVMMHDGASVRVHGSLRCEGTPENPVTISGDRTGNVVGQISFDLMSRQWDGVYFFPESKNNRLTGTIIKNSTNGVQVDRSDLYMLNCVLRNSGKDNLRATASAITAVGCEFAEAGEHLIILSGGNGTFNHCTFANNYLFASMRGAAISLSHLNPDTANPELENEPYTTADFSNSIIYGLGQEISPVDIAGSQIYLRRCLLRSNGTEDTNFISCLWDTDPLYRTIREDYYFDYRLMPDSPAITAADPTLTRQDAATDRYGVARSLELGAYAFDPSDMPDTDGSEQ